MIFRCRLHSDCECGGKRPLAAHMCSYCLTAEPLKVDTLRDGRTEYVVKCKASRQHKPRGAWGAALVLVACLALANACASVPSRRALCVVPVPSPVRDATGAPIGVATELRICEAAR